MNRSHFPGRHRQARAKVDKRVEKVRKKIDEQLKRDNQMRLLNLAASKVRGEVLSEEEHAEQYHSSFDEAAEAIYWHVSPDNWPALSEQFSKLTFGQLWHEWIYPRMEAVRALKKGNSAMVTRPASQHKFFWDDQIKIRTSADAGFPDSHWYEVSLKEPAEKEPAPPEPEPVVITPEPEPQIDEEASPPAREHHAECERIVQHRAVFTPHPVARPWWLQIFNRLRR